MVSVVALYILYPSPINHSPLPTYTHRWCTLVVVVVAGVIRGTMDIAPPNKTKHRTVARMRPLHCTSSAVVVSVVAAAALAVSPVECLDLTWTRH